MNGLHASASPYLRAHADNPVAWFPWGAEAFEEARRRDVPVLVSIGYSTCHWCHVMARESFQDASTAALINDGFVAIKVDREEHPEVDAAYLAAAAAFTPHLGWPLTVFATPDGAAFFAGTYWPPDARPPLPAFRDVLAAVREAWTDRRVEVAHTAAAVRDALEHAAAPSMSAASLPELDDLAAAATRLAEREDPDFGGFADAHASMGTPKFPSVPALRFLQSPALRDAAPRAAGVAARALAAMTASPLHDPADGGFFRYATRRDWTVPHFERMLTDNAGLIEVALDAGDPGIALSSAGFLIDVLQRPSGGFAAAQDSESIIDGARSEGGYYARDAAGRALLEPPAIDGKVVTGWNGLAIGALARAGAALRPERPDDADRLIGAARAAADAVIDRHLRADGRLLRASLDDVASSAPATLEDYGALAEGLVALAVATGEAVHAEQARSLVDACLDGGPEGDPVLVSQGIRPPSDDTDGDHPSGRASFASAAYALWLLGAGDRYRDAAASVIRSGAASALAEPLAHGSLLRVAAQLAAPPRQVVIVARDDASPHDPLVTAGSSLAADVVAIVTADQAAGFALRGFTLFEAKGLQGGVTTLYDCRAFVCRLPVTRPDELARSLPA
ncbi:thioredoxin domain-containing protein [uncultured Microbacterium sp.]|uniref:thioredoxin domain-containing protein n=1 Tax=uncultured Microbacterium sp. TaxID=191216 RepID=UPI0035CB3EF8